MNKKSINCVENEMHNSRAELSNPALQDIIPTNHVVLTKESYRGRLSRACKAVIFMILFGFIVIGIIAVTLILANSRNRFLALTSRTSDVHVWERVNATRRLQNNDENLTRQFDAKEEEVEDEQKHNEEIKNTWPTSTVTLTSDHFEGDTTSNLHLSSLIMHTKQVNEQHLSSQTLSMKPYPSLNTTTNEQLTSSTTTTTTTTVQTTTTDNQETTTMTMTTVRPQTQRRKTVITMNNEVRTTEANRITTEGEIVTTTNNHQSDENLTSTSDISSTSRTFHHEQTSMSHHGLFTTFWNNYFNLETSTLSTEEQRPILTTMKSRRKVPIRKHFIIDDDDDLLADPLFS